MMITNDQIIAAATAAVRSKPEGYVYEKKEQGASCVYAEPDGKPSCLVGHILHSLTPELFKAVVKYENGNPFSTQFNDVCYNLEVRDTFTPEQIAALNRAQIMQDQGYTWSDSLAHLQDQLI